MTGLDISPGLIAKARAEIDAMASGLIPDDKRGVLIGVATQDGLEVGLAAKVRGDDLVVDVSLLQRWKQEKPTLQVRVKWTW